MLVSSPNFAGFRMIAVSIVSHGHGAMVEKLIGALLDCPEVRQIIVTHNVPELLSIDGNDRVMLIDNAAPKGFGANHNAAFSFCEQPFFCPLNPDIELPENPFPYLLKCIAQSGAALVAPLIVSPDGSIEDSVRRFPTLRLLLSKALGGADGRYEMLAGQPDFCPEWVAGMFMLFCSEDFARLNGFDESYFLYYEDVDICVRVWQHGLRVTVCPRVRVIHDARRDSRRNLRHMRWHVASMSRYFWKHWGRLPQVADCRGMQ